MTKTAGIIFYLLLLALIVYGVIAASKGLPSFATNIKNKLTKLAGFCVRLARLIHKLCIFLLKVADNRRIVPGEEKRFFFIAGRFVALAAARGVLLLPIILYSHFPSVTPNLSVLPKPLVVFFGIFCIIVFAISSMLDALGYRRGLFVLKFIFYLIVAYTLLLWYPMFYVVAFMFKWFFPLLAVAAVAAVYAAIKTKRPVFSVALQALVIPACLAFIPAMEVFTIFQPCGGEKDKPAYVEYYLNYCDEGRQLIPKSRIESRLSKETRDTIRAKHRSVIQTGSRVFIGASMEHSFVYDFDGGTVTPLNCGFFSLYEDKPTNQMFIACPQDGMVNVYETSTLKLKESIVYEKFGGPYWLEADDKSRRLFVGFGETLEDRAIIYKLDGLKREKMEPLKKGPGGSVVETTMSQEDGMIYFIDMFNGNYIGRYDLRREKLVGTMDLPWLTLAICYRPESKSLFVTSPLLSFSGGGVVELDPKTFSARGRMTLPVGAKDIVFGGDGLMYVSNYLTGDIYRIDWGRRKILDTVRVGRKIKRMEYSAELNCLMFSSERGYARIDLSKWVTRGNGI